MRATTHFTQSNLGPTRIVRGEEGEEEEEEKEEEEKEEEEKEEERRRWRRRWRRSHFWVMTPRSRTSDL